MNIQVHDTLTGYSDKNPTDRLWIDERPPITDIDRAVLSALPESMPGALGLLAVGEAPLSRLGDIVSTNLLSLNEFIVDKGGQPLFAVTVDNTILMRRFSGAWGCLDAKVLNTVLGQEANRLRANRWVKLEQAFYWGLLSMNRLFGKCVFAVDMNNMMGRDNFHRDLYYLNACSLFQKPWAFEIPPRTFFCLTEFRLNAPFVELDAERKALAESVARPDLERLSAGEMRFLSSLNGF